MSSKSVATTSTALPAVPADAAATVTVTGVDVNVKRQRGRPKQQGGSSSAPATQSGAGGEGKRRGPGRPKQAGSSQVSESKAAADKKANVTTTIGRHWKQLCRQQEEFERVANRKRYVKQRQAITEYRATAQRRLEKLEGELASEISREQSGVTSQMTTEVVGMIESLRNYFNELQSNPPTSVHPIRNFVNTVGNVAQLMKTYGIQVEQVGTLQKQAVTLLRQRASCPRGLSRQQLNDTLQGLIYLSAEERAALAATFEDTFTA